VIGALLGILLFCLALSLSAIWDFKVVTNNEHQSLVEDLEANNGYRTWFKELILPIFTWYIPFVVILPISILIPLRMQSKLKKFMMHGIETIQYISSLQLRDRYFNYRDNLIDSIRRLTRAVFRICWVWSLLALFVILAHFTETYCYHQNYCKISKMSKLAYS
jgi:hypothetical protein